MPPTLHTSGHSPQMGNNATTSGAYALAIESSHPLAYPGKTLTLGIFISGYGKILTPKLFVVMPPGIHDEESSFFYHGLEQSENGSIILGAHKDKLLQKMIVQIGGIEMPHWSESTSFIDLVSEESNVEGTPSILTEYAQPNPLFKIEIKIRKLSLRQLYKEGYRSGEHIAQFILTYYNGNEWISERISHNIILPTWYQQHAFMTWILALAVAIAGVIVALLQLNATP